MNGRAVEQVATARRIEATRSSMHTGRARAEHSTRGFGLVEMMVALSVTAVILLGVYTAFFRSQQAARDITRTVEKRQNARLAMQLLERDLRMAGSGFGRGVVSGVKSGVAMDLNALLPGYGGSVAATDTVGILGGWDFISTLAADMPLTNSVLKVADASGFKTGDFCIITNSQSKADLFQVTAVSFGTGTLTHATTSTFNSAGGHTAWPAGGYGTGSQVYRASWVSYYVDSTSYKKRALLRREAGKAGQMVAYDIQDFQVNYDLQDGTTSRAPASLAMIDKIRPVIRTTATLSGQPSQLDSSFIALRPRAF